MANAFSEGEQFKKRVITVSVTREQDAAFERLKARMNLSTDGAVIKAALAHFIDHVSPETDDSGSSS